MANNLFEVHITKLGVYAGTGKNSINLSVVSETEVKDWYMNWLKAQTEELDWSTDAWLNYLVELGSVKTLVVGIPNDDIREKTLENINFIIEMTKGEIVGHRQACVRVAEYLTERKVRNNLCAKWNGGKRE